MIPGGGTRNTNKSQKGGGGKKSHILREGHCNYCIRANEPDGVSKGHKPSETACPHHADWKAKRESRSKRKASGAGAENSASNEGGHTSISNTFGNSFSMNQRESALVHQLIMPMMQMQAQQISQNIINHLAQQNGTGNNMPVNAMVPFSQPPQVQPSMPMMHPPMLQQPGPPMAAHQPVNFHQGLPPGYQDPESSNQQNPR